LLKFKPCSEWESEYYKYSHEGKTLVTHIREVKNLLENFFDFYDDFSEIYLKTAEYLAEYHDRGKLCKKWRLNGGSFPHSYWSLQWIWDNKKVFDSHKKLTPILWYFILKHHSRLTERTTIPEGNFLVKEATNLIEEMDFKERVNLVDTFGLFKIADILSASNKIFKLRPPSITKNDIKRIIGNRIDKDRWKQQLELLNLKDIGILRAYTGWGKTTASLLYIVNKPIKKVFYLLPTITAINKFYGKLLEIFPEKVSKYFYFYDAELREETEQLNELFFAENFLSPIVITTVDQFLLSFLQYGKYHTKRVMFRNSCLILDEIHLLNPLMLNLVVYFLNKYFDAYKIKALFMSATLSDALSQFLRSEISGPTPSFLDYSDGYYSKRRILLEYNSNPLEDNTDKILELLEKNKKVLMIVNTIEKAIKLTRLLERDLSREKIILLHSRFMYKDRRRKENEIDRKTGIPHILVSTQISEVSLDISYDVLFTELSPFPSLIQRFGRVNRYGTTTNAVNVYVYEPESYGDEYYPYEKERIDVARKILKEIEGANLENEGRLLDSYNDIYSYDDLLKEIENIKRKVDIEAFEEELKSFFSLDVKEEKLMKILRYRDSFNVLVVPDPVCIIDEKPRKYVESIISKQLNKLNFKERRKIIAKIKDALVSIPIWWMEEGKISKEAPYPVVIFEDKIYSEYYGLVKGGILYETKLSSVA